MSYEAGIHNCTIGSQGFRTSAKGNTVFWFEVTPEGGKYSRRVEWTITDKTIEFVLDKLARLGVSGISSWSALDPETDGYTSLAGQVVELLNQPEQGKDGKTYDRFDLPPLKAETRQPEKAAKKAIRDLDTLFGKALKSKFNSRPAPLTRQPDNMITGVARATKPDPDDGIPF